MIPYDDLVAALSAWRARQGLPVSTLGGAGPGSGPTATPGSGPNRGGPPMPPRATTPAGEELDVDEANMLEEQYDPDAEGGEYGASANGGAPERPTDSDISGGARGGSDRDDW